MHFVMLGALLELAGIVFLVVHVMRHEQPAAPETSQAPDTLEPVHQGWVFPLRGSWPGFALLAFGALLLLIGGRI
jgi:hypothetical protein